MQLSVGQNVREQIENDLELEIGAVAQYNAAIEVARLKGDNVSRELFERLLRTRKITSTGSKRNYTRSRKSDTNGI